MSAFTWLRRLLDVALPDICPGCRRHRPPRGQWLCLSCEARLPLTDHHLYADNPVTERLWGRFPLESGAAMLLFRKDGIAQQLIHHLKYKGRRVVGYELGRRYGSLLAQSPHFQGVEIIVPVPLHPRKEKLRGYNQAAVFGQGLAKTMRVPLMPDALQRHRYTETQTRKSQTERLRNVAGAFGLHRPERLHNRHVLIVDDVLTTGATLESCATTLLQVPGLRVSVATIAMAH